MTFGINEGRKINQYFDVNAYKAAYPDLAKAFGDNTAMYYQHFVTFGIKEHRTLGGFPAENILPGGVKKATASASSGGSSGGSGGSSGGGSSTSGGGSGSIVIPGSGDAQKQGTIKANTASLDAVNDTLADEIQQLDRTDANAVLNAINKAQAALDNANANKKAADDYAKETADNYKAAGLALKDAQANAIKGLEDTDAAKVKRLTVDAEGVVTANGATEADNLYNKAKALQVAENALVNAQVDYNQALADYNTAKAAAAEAAKVVASARTNAANLVKAVDPNAYRAVDPDSTDSVQSAINDLATAHALDAARTAATDYLKNDKVDADKVKTAKDNAAKAQLATYQSAYVNKLIDDLKGTDATAQTTAKSKLGLIFGGTISLSDDGKVMITIGDAAPRELKPSTGDDKVNQEKITSETIGNFTTSTLNNKTLSEAIAADQKAIQDVVDEFNLATDINAKKDGLDTAVQDQGVIDGTVTSNQNALSAKTTALTNAEGALTTAQGDLTAAQGAYDDYYAGLVTAADAVPNNDTTEKDEHAEALAIANKQAKAGADIKNQIQNAGTLDAVKDAADHAASDAATTVNDATNNLKAATGATH